jgi:hypothetical protein
VYDGLGAVSFETLLSSLGPDGALRASVERVEALRALKLARFPALGVDAYYHTTIVDLRGISLAHLTRTNRSFVRRAFAFAKSCYPETVHRIYLIHSPSAFPLIWKAVRPFVDPDTAEKVHVLSSRETRDLMQKWEDVSEPERSSARASGSTASSTSSAGPRSGGAEGGGGAREEGVTPARKEKGALAAGGGGPARWFASLLEPSGDKRGEKGSS